MVLGGTPAQVGWLGTAQAAGGLIAGVIVARFGGRLATRWLLGGGLVGIGLADLGTAKPASSPGPAFPPSRWPWAGRRWPACRSSPPARGGILVQTQAADAYRGRVFGALGAVQGGALLLGFAIGGLLGGAWGLVPTLSAGAMVRVLGGLLALWLLPQRDERGDLVD